VKPEAKVPLGGSGEFLDADDVHEGDALLAIDESIRATRNADGDAVFPYPHEVPVLDVKGPPVRQVQVKGHERLGIAQREDVFWLQHGQNLAQRRLGFNSLVAVRFILRVMRQGRFS